MDQEHRSDLEAVLRALWPPARRPSPPLGDRLYVDGSQLRASVPNRSLKNLDNEPLKDGFGRQLQFAKGAKFFVGGSGVVLQCEPIPGSELNPDTGLPEDVRPEETPQIAYALKCPRVSIFERDDLDSGREYARAKREERVQIKLAHPHIAKVFASFKSEVVGPGGDRHPLTFVLIEWIEGAQQLRRYLADRDWSGFELARLLRAAFLALDHLHSKNLIHWDLKGDNLQVSAEGTLKLMDLGNARDRRRAPYDGLEEALTTRRNLPPALQERYLQGEAPSHRTSNAEESTNRVAIPLFPGENWDTPVLDMYFLARELNRLFGFDDKTLDLDSDVMTSETLAEYETIRREHRRRSVAMDDESRYAYRYLELLTRRLLASEGRTDDAYYESARDVVAAIDRLSPAFGAADEVPELQIVPQHVLRLPGLSNVPWTTRISAVANASPMRRLKLHRQLATVNRVYPGAEHTRWEHTLGTLLSVVLYVRALFADRTGVVFRADVTRMDIEALLLAALLHDIGHPAFGHQFEEWPLVDKPHRHDSYCVWLLDLCIRGVVEEDVHLTDSVLSSLEADAAILKALIAQFWASDPTDLLKRAREILAPQRTSPFRRKGTSRQPDVARTPTPQWIELDKTWSSGMLTEILHSIINGDCDADKLDYLKRDGVHCGVEYPAGIDELRLLQALTTITDRVDGFDDFRPTIGVTTKGVLPLESFVIARYQMFRSVYWHRTVRALTVSLHFVLDYLVLVSASAPEREKALTSLWREVRRLSDNGFLEYLSDELKNFRVRLKTGSAEELRSRRVEDAISGLKGDRDKIYWAILSLFGESDRESAQGNELYDPEQDEPPSEDGLYWALVDVWWPEGLGGLRLVRHRQEVRREVGKNLAANLQGLKVAIHVIDGDVLIDVPEPGKEQSERLFVHLDRAEPQRILPFADVTGVGVGVQEAFRRSLRQARVYLRPSVVDSLRDRGMSLAEIQLATRRAVWDAVRLRRLTVLGTPVERL